MIQAHVRQYSYKDATILPGSQHFAAGGEIELAYHRIRTPAAELNRSQHVELIMNKECPM